MQTILDYVLPLMSVQTPEELQTELAKATTAMGFDIFSAFVLVDNPDGTRDNESVHNLPPAYLTEWHDPTASMTDPVMIHCKNTGIPIIWGLDTYTEVGQADMWETMAGYGLKTGLSIASHHSGNRHFCIGLEREAAIPLEPSEMNRMYADLTLLSVYAQDAALRILVKPAGPSKLPSLTPREREALQWSGHGKTAWEIGQILAVSEGTVAKFLQSAQFKLDACNKVAAVATAMRLGLI